ncbi:MAG: hypothetical protein H0V95_12270 [Actinobacteria bacterium]|nr:hypothetical protein [Actinomycetota bacterium]
MELAVSPRTLRRYQEYVRLHTRPVLGACPLNSVGPRELQSLYADRISSGQSRASVLHLHRLLHGAFGHAVTWGLPITTRQMPSILRGQSVRRCARGHFLFVLCMLRHIEADDKAFERIANDNRFRSAGQHVQRTDQR